jgi:tetratricopeptide (TPR) repeat protein
MDRITRKSLKDDRFAAEVTHSVEYIAQHRRQTLIYGGIGVAVVALVVGFILYRNHRENAAHLALAKAFETYRALVTEEDRPGRVTFKTEQAKNDQALKDFQAVVSGFSGSQEAEIARYYVGLVYRDSGKLPEAQKELEGLIGSRQDDVRSLARLTLAEVYAAGGKTEEARKTYEYLIKNPTATVPEPRAQLAMARFLSKQQPDQARQLLLELQKRTGAVAVTAGTMLRDLGQ